MEVGKTGPITVTYAGMPVLAMFKVTAPDRIENIETVHWHGVVAHSDTISLFDPETKRTVKVPVNMNGSGDHVYANPGQIYVQFHAGMAQSG